MGVLAGIDDAFHLKVYGNKVLSDILQNGKAHHDSRGGGEAQRVN